MTTEAIAKEPSFVAAMPEGYSRNSSHIGLTETLAWVVSRDKRVSDAAYYWLHISDERRTDGTWALAFDLVEAFDDATVEAVDEIFRVCAEGELKGYGRRCAGSTYEEIDANTWINMRIGYEDVPDCIMPSDTRDPALMGKPVWSHIVFKRADVLARWPAAAELSVTKPKSRHPSNLAEADAPLVRRMKALIERNEASVPYAAALHFVDGARAAVTQTQRLAALNAGITLRSERSRRQQQVAEASPDDHAAEWARLLATGRRIGVVVYAGLNAEAAEAFEAAKPKESE